MSEEDYKLMEVLIIERKPHRNGPQWKFAGNLAMILKTSCLFVFPSFDIQSSPSQIP